MSKVSVCCLHVRDFNALLHTASQILLLLQLELNKLFERINIYPVKSHKMMLMITKPTLAEKKTAAVFDTAYDTTPTTAPFGLYRCYIHAEYL